MDSGISPTIFAHYTGMGPENEASEQLLKAALVNGLRMDLKSHFLTLCVGWEGFPLQQTSSHATHAERRRLTQKTKWEKRQRGARTNDHQQRRSRGCSRRWANQSWRWYNKLVWCYTCGSRSQLACDCPSPVQPEGQDRQGWKFSILRSAYYMRRIWAK